MGTITAADAILTLAVFPLFPIPQQLQGFATDDIYNIPQIKSVETMMGVDGVLSGGFVFVQKVQKIVLQADSLSNRLFEIWNSQEEATKGVYTASGMIQLPSIQTKFTQVKGFLTGYTPAPAGKKVLQPREYEITWEAIRPAPTF